MVYSVLDPVQDASIYYDKQEEILASYHRCSSCDALLDEWYLDIGKGRHFHPICPKCFLEMHRVDIFDILEDGCLGDELKLTELELDNLTEETLPKCECGHAFTQDMYVIDDMLYCEECVDDYIHENFVDVEAEREYDPYD